MNYIKTFFHFTNRYIKDNLLRLIAIVSIVFFFSGFAFYFAVKCLPQETLQEIYTNIAEMFAAKDVINADGSLSFLGILWNNIRAGLLISITGVIPFLFLPLLYVMLNSGLISAILAILSVLSEENVLLMVVKFILPHGIFEIPALILEGAIGMKFCAFLCRKIFGKAKGAHILLHLKGSLGVFLIYVVPLLIVAAFIEAVVLGAIYSI